MGTEKAIASGKEKRKPYRGSKAFDRTCRNHGDCPWCEGSRRYKRAKAEPRKEDNPSSFPAKAPA